MDKNIIRLRSLLSEKGLSLEEGSKVIGCALTQLWRWLHERSRPRNMSIIAIKRAIKKIERLPADQDFRELMRQRDLFKALSKKISVEEKIWLMGKPNLYGRRLEALAKKHGVEIPSLR
ncbi:MAG: hypothetical protein WBC70_18700 [Candidatus Aminicenantales bacterium]